MCRIRSAPLVFTTSRALLMALDVQPLSDMTPTVTFLTSITDACGNVSSFVYDPSSSFITMMTTPYGSTSFYQYTPAGGGTYPPVGLRTTLPDGTSSVIENWIDGVDQKETYFWDREATALYPNDPANRIYSHCESTRWLFNAPTFSESAVAGLEP